jgi:hypothetical protein
MDTHGIREGIQRARRYRRRDREEEALGALAKLWTAFYRYRAGFFMCDADEDRPCRCELCDAYSEMLDYFGVP